GVLPVLRLAGGARMRVRQAEQSGRVAAENCALVLLGQERQIVNRAGQVEVPVRVIGGEQQLGLRVDHLEREFQRLLVVRLHRLGGEEALANVFTRQLLQQRRLV